MPERAHAWDAGLDIKSRTKKLITSFGSAIFDTGVHVEIPEGYVGFVKSKSGMMVRDGITTDGTIDAGYTGPIKVKLFNNHSYAFSVKPGQKIAQLVIVPCETPEVIEVKKITGGARGDNGFGSTGK